MSGNAHSPLRWMPLAPLAAAALACSSAAAPPGAPSAPAAPAPEPASSAAGPAPVAGSSGPAEAVSDAPSARVIAIAPSTESAPYARAKVEFKNPTARPCRIPRYKLLWGSSSKEIKLEDFAVPAGEIRERWIKVHPDDGDLGALSPESARVELQSDCGG